MPASFSLSQVRAIRHIVAKLLVFSDAAWCFALFEVVCTEQPFFQLMVDPAVNVLSFLSKSRFVIFLNIVLNEATSLRVLFIPSNQY